MKCCIKKISGIIFILILVLGFVSCKPEVVVTDTTAPGCVTNVNAESEEGKIVLTWTDPSDSDLLGIKIYNGTEIQARTASFSDGILVGKGIQKYEVTNLEDGNKYSFRISAVDNALNESEKVTIAALKFSAKVVSVTKYVCPKDEKEFATAEEAANCCGVQTVEKEVTVYKYVCPKDKKEYATAQEAADCCGVQIEYVDKEVEKIVKKYVCPRDGKEYDTAKEAKECCGPVVEEKLVYTTAVKAGTYTVYHFQQNTSGGKAFADYTLYTTENSKAVAENSTLENLKKTYAGFTAKALAQNETVLYIFYDRNVITYTYLSGTEGKFSDGTTEKVVNGLYGAPVSAPIVTSSTHNFDGWFTSDNAAPGSTYGAEDLTFTVKWTPKATGGFNWYETPVDAETGNVATAASKYIYFGVFPKTVLPENSAVTVDETEIKIMGANTYYKGNDGNWYAKVTENCCNSSGYTYSDGTTVKQSGAASTRYFKVEPIKWKVLTTDYNGTGRALLLAEDILTANVPYYVNTSSRTIGGKTVYENNYKYSTIRAYLNGAYESDDTQTKTYEGKGFLQTAFTTRARLFISDTEVNNSESTSANNYYCENTEDKIFLLWNFSEAYNSYGIGNAGIRIRKTTDYAKANYAFQSTTDGYGGDWWLRSPFRSSSNSVYLVTDNGGVTYSTGVHYTSPGIVPALSLSLE